MSWRPGWWEEQLAEQEGWFWSGRGSRPNGWMGYLHFPGPKEGWSACGSARLRQPANHTFRGDKHPRIGHKCESCVRVKAVDAALNNEVLMAQVNASHQLPADFKLDAIYMTRRQVEREPKC